MDGNERLGEMDEERRGGHCGTRKSNVIILDIVLDFLASFLN